MLCIYSGYLALECLDADDEESQICGLCGIIPEAILGDLKLMTNLAEQTGAELCQAIFTNARNSSLTNAAKQVLY